MSFPLPLFIAVPLVMAFLLPMFGRKGKTAATVLANLVTVSLLVFAVASIGKTEVYEVGKWSIPLGINLVLDGLSSLLLLAL
jgi:multicomponent Na+:H+ antiporter subunit D